MKAGVRNLQHRNQWLRGSADLSCPKLIPSNVDALFIADAGLKYATFNTEISD